MPWCGYGFWGAPLGGAWWLFPLIGFLFMALMFALCFRVFGRWWGWRAPRGAWAWHRRGPEGEAELSELRRDVARLRDELQQLRRTT